MSSPESQIRLAHAKKLFGLLCDALAEVEDDTQRGMLTDDDVNLDAARAIRTSPLFPSGPSVPVSHIMAIAAMSEDDAVFDKNIWRKHCRELRQDLRKEREAKARKMAQTGCYEDLEAVNLTATAALLALEAAGDLMQLEKYRKKVKRSVETLTGYFRDTQVLAFPRAV